LRAGDGRTLGLGIRSLRKLRRCGMGVGRLLLSRGLLARRRRRGEGGRLELRLCIMMGMSMRRSRLHAGFRGPRLFVAGLGILVAVPMSSSSLPEAVFVLLPPELELSFSHGVGAGYKEKCIVCDQIAAKSTLRGGNDGPGVFSKTVAESHMPLSSSVKNRSIADRVRIPSGL